jgi:hypothetical protein
MVKYDQPGKYDPYKRNKPDGCIRGGDNCFVVRWMRRIGLSKTADAYLRLVHRIFGGLGITIGGCSSSSDGDGGDEEGGRGSRGDYRDTGRSLPQGMDTYSQPWDEH